MCEITVTAEETLTETDEGQVYVAPPPVLATPAAVVTVAGGAVVTAAIK